MLSRRTPLSRKRAERRHSKERFEAREYDGDDFPWGVWDTECQRYVVTDIQTQDHAVLGAYYFGLGMKFGLREAGR